MTIPRATRNGFSAVILLLVQAIGEVGEKVEEDGHGSHPRWWSNWSLVKAYFTLSSSSPGRQIGSPTRRSPIFSSTRTEAKLSTVTLATRETAPNSVNALRTSARTTSEA